MIGRTAELDLVRASLDRGEIVQIVGPPGIGKSTLARAAAEGRSVLEVSLESVTPDRLEDAIARALDVPAQRGAVIGALKDVELLMLDGAESVADSLMDLLDALRPSLVLITTRHRMAGGVTVELGPLPTEEAISLFRERASLVGADDVVERERGAVEALVARLEGWPLALELAASRMRVYAPAELLESPTLPVLRDASRGGRHGSLAAALEASWRLLEPEERAALTAVSLYRGPFGREGFQSVTGQGLDVLERLLDASLVQWSSSGGARSYEVLAPIREFALEQGVPAEAHARYATTVLERAEAEALRAETSDAMKARQHLSRATPDLEALLDLDPETSARAALVLAVLARARGPVPTAIGWLAAVPRDPLPDSLRMELDVMEADLGIRAFEGKQPLVLLAPWPDTPRTVRLRGLALLRERHVEEAVGTLQRAIELADATGDGYESAYARLSLGVATWQNGSAPGAVTVLREALDRVTRIDAPDIEGLILKFLCSVERELGAPMETRVDWVERAVALHRRTGNTRHEAMALNVLAITRLDGNDPRADEVIAEGSRIAERAGLVSTVEQMLFLQTLEALADETALGRAESLLDELERTRPQPFMRNWMHALRGIVAVHRGKSELAIEEVRQGRDGAVREGLPGDARLFGALLALLGGGEAPEPAPGLPRGAPERMLCELAAQVSRGEPLSSAQIRAASGFSEVRAFVGVTAAGAGTEVAEDGTWFRVRGEERVDLRRRRVLCRVLSGLAQRRGDPITHEELLEVGWPGESPTPSSGRARVHVAIADLRRMGLREALQTVEVEGETAYRLVATLRG